MNLVSVKDRVLNHQWLMDGDSVWSLYEDVCSLSQIRLGGLYGKVFGDPIMLSTGTQLIPSQEAEGVGNTAIVTIAGTLVKGADDTEAKVLGFVDTDKIGQAIDKIAEDDSIEKAILCFASGGGEVTGTPELGRKIKQLDGIKPVYSWVEFNAQSAAYWLASQARYIGMTPSAQVGSIGVFLLRMDISGKLAKDGIIPHFIHAGDFKGIRSELTPLSDEEKEILTADIVETHDEFKSAVSTSRPQANVEAMKGLSYMGTKALANGLVDLVTDDFSTFLDEIAKH
jgi:signal peptide peptidase SppA